MYSKRVYEKTSTSYKNHISPDFDFICLSEREKTQLILSYYETQPGLEVFESLKTKDEFVRQAIYVAEIAEADLKIDESKYLIVAEFAFKIMYLSGATKNIILPLIFLADDLYFASIIGQENKVAIILTYDKYNHKE